MFIGGVTIFSKNLQSMTRLTLSQRLLIRVIQIHVRFEVWIVSMILPQVHLRKPCYDFYFL